MTTSKEVLGPGKEMRNAGFSDVKKLSDWLLTNMPAGTVIGDPEWWAGRISRVCGNPALAQPTQAVPPGYVLVPEYADADAVVSALYRRFKDWSKRGFGPDDVTWCEVKADIAALVAATSQPSPEQPSVTVDTPEFRSLMDFWAGQMQSSFTRVRQGSEAAYQALIGKINQWQRCVTAKAAADERERAARLAIQWGNARHPGHGGNALRNYAQALRDGAQVDERPSDYHWSNAPSRPQVAAQDNRAALTNEVIEHCWKMYQQGQISADHTAKEVFASTLQSLAVWLVNQHPPASAPRPAPLLTREAFTEQALYDLYLAERNPPAVATVTP